jgi:branched-chain amino acid transport system substrate-binding protein
MRQIIPYSSYSRKISLLASLILIMMAARCQPSPTPPLPPTPSEPAIRVALLAPNLGELAPFGRMMRNGSMMAFEEWNEQGGILGHRIEWVIYDTACQFDSAQQAIRQVIEDGLTLVIGPLCSDAAIAAAAEAESAGLLMISPTATHPLVTITNQGQTRPTIFRVSHSYATQGQATAQFGRQTLAAERAAIISNPADGYARTLADAFAQEFVRQGGKIVYQATYSPGSTDFAQQLTASLDSEADLFYLPVPASVANQLAGQLQTLERPTTSSSPRSEPILLGSDSWDSPELDPAAAAGSYFFTHFALSDSNPLSQTWAAAYRSAYAVEPDALAALGYDAVQLLLTASQQAGTFDPAAVATALEQGDFKGVTGPIKFDRHHDPIKPATIIHLEQGQETVLGP